MNFDAPLTLKEFLVAEPVPLATVFRVVFEFLRGRKDVVVFGAQAVNVYVDEPRMTHDVDILSTHAEEVADGLRAALNRELHIATRVRAVAGSKGFRVYQVKKEGSRHLVDVRQTSELPTSRREGGLAVLAPLELIGMKVLSAASRGGQEKGLSDRLDLLRLLRKFPSFRESRSKDVLRLLGGDIRAGLLWEEIRRYVPEKPSGW